MKRNNLVSRISVASEIALHSKTAFKVELAVGSFATAVMLSTELSPNEDGLLAGLMTGALVVSILTGGTLLDDKISLKKLQNSTKPEQDTP